MLLVFEYVHFLDVSNSSHLKPSPGFPRGRCLCALTCSGRWDLTETFQAIIPPNIGSPWFATKSPRFLWCRTQNLSILFFFKYTATSQIYTLSLHDALPISILSDEIADIIVFDLLLRVAISRVSYSFYF